MVEIPTKIVMGNSNAFARFLVKDINKCINNEPKSFLIN